MYVKLIAEGTVSFHGPYDQDDADAFAAGAALAGANVRVVPDIQRAKLDQDEYADSGMCPNCGGDPEWTRTTDSGHEAPDGFVQGMKCTACNATWESSYTLSGYFNLQFYGEHVAEKDA
jgi:hypothetical protein